MNKNSAAKKKKVQLCWDAVEGADGSEAYEVQYYKQSKKTKQALKKQEDPFDSFAKTKEIVGDTCVQVKMKPGKYKWKVRIQGGENWSEEKGVKIKN